MVQNILLATLGSIMTIISMFYPSNPETQEIILKSNVGNLVFYNYTYVTYTSPFALNYSYLLFGNTYKIEQPQIEQITETKTTKEQFSLDWFIALENKCPLPNKARIEVKTNSKVYLLKKINLKFEIEETVCSNCDISIIVNQFPNSENEAKKFIDEGKIKINLNKNIFDIISKGYASTYSCLIR